MTFLLSISIITARLNEDPRRVYDKLKQALLELDFVRPGSVVKRFMPCGKPSCRCMGKPPRLHGPYYQWSYKLRGKTVSMRLTSEQAKLCQEWLENHVSGVTIPATSAKSLRPRTLPFTASLRRSSSVKRSLFPRSRALRTRFSSRK